MLQNCKSGNSENLLLPKDGIGSSVMLRLSLRSEWYDAAYGSELFVRVVGTALPEIKHVAHTNFCDIGWRVNASGRAVIVSVIDNLVKGASGQAVQNMNVMVGAPEEAGLL